MSENKLESRCKKKMDVPDYENEFTEKFIPKYLQRLKKDLPKGENTHSHMIILIDLKGRGEIENGIRYDYGLSEKQFGRLIRGESSTTKENKDAIKRMEDFDKKRMEECLNLTRNFQRDENHIWLVKFIEKMNFDPSCLDGLDEIAYELIEKKVEESVRSLLVE